MKTFITFLLPFSFLLWGCGDVQHPLRIRSMVDTIGFASHACQVDSVLSRISRMEHIAENPNLPDTALLAISPHDDYSYAGWHYPAVLRRIKAKTVVMFGVAHKARLFGLDNRLIFDSFDGWYAPDGTIPVSPLRDSIIASMPDDMVMVHDSMHIVEHSVEAMLPFLQHFNPDLRIIPVLVPYMPYRRIVEIAHKLAVSIAGIMDAQGLAWGRDIALLITTDAVHYGDTDWGGRNYAPFGADSSGYRKAIAHEHGIIDSTLLGPILPNRIERFVRYTVDSTDYREYRWTWCGRYSIPMGLSTAFFLADLLHSEPPSGTLVGYSTSIDHRPVPVDDLKMGVTAPANIRHWVGYVSVVYR